MCTLTTSVKMGKGVESVKTREKQGSDGGRKLFGKAKERGKTVEAVKGVRQKGFKRGGGRKKISPDGKTKRVKRPHGASTPDGKEGGRKGHTTLVKNSRDSGEVEETVKTDERGTAGTQTARRGKRKRVVGASKLRSKAFRSVSRRKKRVLARRGVIYIAHLPLGFFEPQLNAFFSQFGEVSRVRLFRSRKTGHSKGYAFVEFGLREVAQIAAETLDKYRMFGRTLVCRLMDRGQIKNHVFRRCHKPFRRIDWQSLAAAQHNKPEDRKSVV